MANCGLITTGVVRACGSFMKGGLRDNTVYLINSSEILSYTFNATNATIIEAITLEAGGKRSYQFDGFQSSSKPAWRQVTGRGYGPQFEHELEILLFDVSRVGKDVVQELVLGSYVAIVETNNDEQPFIVLGKDVGLRAVESERILQDAAAGGTIRVMLKTPEDGPPETYPAWDFFVTSRAATDTVVKGLLTPTA